MTKQAKINENSAERLKLVANSLWYSLYNGKDGKAGFTEAAMQKLRTEGIYFSDLAQFNALSALFGLLPLSI